MEKLKKFFILLVLACFGGNAIAAPICNIGANPWWKDRPLAEGWSQYRITTPIRANTYGADNKKSGECELVAGTVIAFKDGFETWKEHPELKVLPSDSPQQVFDKLVQLPYVVACGNPDEVPFLFTVINRNTKDGIPEAEMMRVSGNNNVTISGSNNSVYFSPNDEFRHRERQVEEESSCGTGCKILWGIAGALVLGAVLSSGGGNDSPPPPKKTAAEGNTGGGGNGGETPGGTTN